MPCLLPKYADEFLRRIQSGEMDPGKLMDMTSAERHKYFGEFLGEENAGWVNASFESKMLLKYQQQGLVSWAKSIGNLKEARQTDLLSRVHRMSKVLEPKDMNSFLADLAEQRLGVGVTVSEATDIYHLAQKATESRKAMEAAPRRALLGKATPQEEAYGRALIEMNNHVANLKAEAAAPKGAARVVEFVRNVPGMTKSIRASLDNSALFRQGWKTLTSDPKVWATNATKSIADIVRSYGWRPIMDEVMADIASRPNYQRMRTAKLDVGNIEEAFPGLTEQLQARSESPVAQTYNKALKVVTTPYTASENAFTAFQRRTRADLFDKYVDLAEKQGVDINNKQELQSIGRMVNSLTGRGYLGKLEPAANTVNSLLFSPRFFKSNLDVLTLGQAQGEMTPFARKQAAIASLKTILSTATMLAAIKGVGAAFGHKDVVEEDPRSANFGKVRIGDTRFDLTGGFGSIVTLAARTVPALWGHGAVKSSITGKVSPLNQGGYRGQTTADVLGNFAEGKLSPTSSVVLSMLRGEDFIGRKPTVGSIAQDLFVPMPITNAIEVAKNPNSAPWLLTVVADGLGIGANTYSGITWHPPRDERRVAGSYAAVAQEPTTIRDLNVPADDTECAKQLDTFLPLLKKINDAGATIAEPAEVILKKKPGEDTGEVIRGSDLEEYRILRGVLIRNALMASAAYINRQATDNPKVLGEWADKLIQRETRRAKGMFQKSRGVVKEPVGPPALPPKATDTTDTTEEIQE